MISNFSWFWPAITLLAVLLWISAIRISRTESMKRASARQAEAECERRAKVMHAEGALQASEKLFHVARIFAQGPQAIRLSYLKTLTVIGADKNTAIVFPLPMDIVSSYSGQDKIRPGTHRFTSGTNTSFRIRG